MRVFWAKVSKKGNFWIPCQKKKKILTDNWKALFLVFLCFLLFLSWLFFFCCFFVVFLFCLFCFVFVLFLFGGFKGQVRWPKGPPHLALNPPYFFVFVFFCFFVLFFFGGFKGQVRWPKGPPHLALNPPYFLFVFCWFLFFFFALLSLFFLIDKKPVFPPRKGHFLLIFNVSLSFSLNLFWPPPFSVSLSLSLCCSFLFTFLLVFLFCFLFVSCFCLFLSLSFFIAFVSWKEKHQNIQLQFFPEIFSLFFVSCLAFLFQIPFSYLCFFSWF